MAGIQMGKERCESNRSVIELYLRSQRAHFYRYVEYRSWMAPFMVWLSVCYTYPGAYLDTLIVINGWALIKYFNLITERLRILEPYVRIIGQVCNCGPFAWHGTQHLSSCAKLAIT